MAAKSSLRWSERDHWTIGSMVLDCLTEPGPRPRAEAAGRSSQSSKIPEKFVTESVSRNCQQRLDTVKGGSHQTPLQV